MIQQFCPQVTLQRNGEKSSLKDLYKIALFATAKK